MSTTPPARSQSGSNRVVRAILITPVMLSAHLAALLVLVVFMVTTVPDYERWFEQAEAELPRTTISVLMFSRYTISYWYGPSHKKCPIGIDAKYD